MSRKLRPMKPVFKTGKELGEALDALYELFALIDTGSPKPRCLVPLRDGGPCRHVPTGSHSIQERILNRFAKEGHVKTFPTDMRTALRRLTSKKDVYYRSSLFQDHLWIESRVGIGDASKRPFACECHDTATFRSIEHSQPGELHPLSVPELTEKQYFLLCYRILMFEIEVRSFLERIWEKPSRRIRRSRIRRVRKDPRFKREAKAIMGINRQVANLKPRFDTCYINEDFHSLIETPIDERIQLPIQIAVASLFNNSIDNGLEEVFLTIVPTEPEPGTRDSYEHRVIASRLHTSTDAAESSIRAIKCLLARINESADGADSLLIEILGASGNAFFSHQYETRTSERTRNCIARRHAMDMFTELYKLAPYLFVQA